MQNFYLTILLILIFFLSCSIPSSGFSVKTTYIAENFNSRALSGFSIGLSPLLTKNGINLIDSIGCEKIVQELRNMRSDLLLIASNRIMEQLKAKISKQTCDSLFLNMYSENTMRIQLYDSLWQSLTCDYLLVIRLHDGMNIRTFNNVLKKRVFIETELWNCKRQEPVWRTNVYGITLEKKTNDLQVICETIKKACNNLPVTLPSYGNEKW
jgi:hypothetical protein